MKLIIGGITCIGLGLAITYFSYRGLKNTEAGSYKNGVFIKGVGLGIVVVLFGIYILSKKT